MATNSDLRSIIPSNSRRFISTTVKRFVRDRLSLTETLYTNTANAVPVTMHATRSNENQPMLSFTFPFTPQQIQYGNIGPELQEISRPGKMPIVAFSRFRSRQLSIKFLIAVPNDGLFTSVDNDLELLFDMANLARPVFFTNMDKQISNPMGTTDASKNIFWSITDLNFSSIRRNEQNQITAAEANMTLVENVNPSVVVADLPAITYNTTVNIPKKDNPDPVPDFLDYTVVRDSSSYGGAISGNIDAGT
jgi:hypothetical protein